MEEKLISLLESIGLSRNEILVYLDLLKNKMSTAYSIANRVNQHRSGVYDSLKKLQQRGFILEILDENRKLYHAKEYTVIEEYLKQKQNEAKEVVPYLKEIANINVPAGSISVSYGLTRLRTTFSSLFDLKQELLIWVIPQNVDQILGDWFLKEINTKIIKKETEVKIIYSKNFDITKEIVQGPNTEVKYVPEDTNIFTIVCADTVFLIVLADPITVVEMKNIDIAEGFKSRFYNFWDKAEMVRKKLG